MENGAFGPSVDEQSRAGVQAVWLGRGQNYCATTLSGGKWKTGRVRPDDQYTLDTVAHSSLPFGFVGSQTPLLLTLTEQVEYAGRHLFAHRGRSLRVQVNAILREPIWLFDDE